MEIYVENKSKTFSRFLGRTNTEYFTATPVYGSNLNATLVKKPDRDFKKAKSGWISTEPREYTGLMVESNKLEGETATPYTVSG